MKPAPFSYHAPPTLAEAVALLGQTASEDGRVLAGGQSLVPMMALRLAYPAHLIDINRVRELVGIAVEADELVIRALVRHVAFRTPVENGPLGRLLARVVQDIAHYPIQMRGTFCGSLANADPASEWCLVAATLGARLVTRNQSGERVIPAEAFFRGIMTTAMEPDELLCEVRLPRLAADTRFGFNEFNRRAGDFALAMSLITFRLEGGVITEPRVGVGGAEEHPRRLAEAEAVLDGNPPSEAVLAAAAEAAAAAIVPIEDAQTSAAYRRDVVRAVTRRALAHAAGLDG